MPAEGIINSHLERLCSYKYTPRLQPLLCQSGLKREQAGPGPRMSGVHHSAPERRLQKRTLATGAHWWHDSLSTKARGAPYGLAGMGWKALEPNLQHFITSCVCSLLL
eukprot:5371414-Amphidinium_carterae.2